MKPTLLSVAITIALVATAAIGGYLLGKGQQQSPEVRALPGLQSDVPYGTPLAKDPLWQVNFAYKAPRLFGASFYPGSAKLYWKEKPNITVIQKEIPVPDFLSRAGFYVCPDCEFLATKVYTDVPQPEKDRPNAIEK